MTMGEIFKAFKERKQARNNVRDEYYSKIMNEVGATYLNNATYRLGDYNVYVSKGYAKHKSNKGKGIPLQKLLKDKYNYLVDGRELNELMKGA